MLTKRKTITMETNQITNQQIKQFTKEEIEELESRIRNRVITAEDVFNGASLEGKFINPLPPDDLPPSKFSLSWPFFLPTDRKYIIKPKQPIEVVGGKVEERKEADVSTVIPENFKGQILPLAEGFYIPRSRFDVKILGEEAAAHRHQQIINLYNFGTYEKCELIDVGILFYNMFKYLPIGAIPECVQKNKILNCRCRCKERACNKCGSIQKTISAVVETVLNKK